MDRETARRAQLPVSHQIILREIEHAADQGAPCPSNGALCGLADEKRIAWQAGSATQRPVVTILAKGRGCGKSTAGGAQ